MRFRLGDQRGQTASEYLGILLLVGAVVAAFAQLDVGGRIAAGIDEAICEIVGVSCPAPARASTGPPASRGTGSSARSAGASRRPRAAQPRSAGGRAGTAPGRASRPVARAARATSRQPEAPQIKARHFRYPFQNFDYDGKSRKRDNPVTVIFVSRRPDMVKRLYDQLDKVGLDGSGNTMRLRGVGGSRRGVSSKDPWTSHSAGRKGAKGCYGHCGKNTDIHVRTYGPNGHQGTQVYQGNYGYAPYYLVATTHFDRDEDGPKRAFGWQDKARDILVKKMVAEGRWRVVGKTNVKNACRSTTGNHNCQSDGNATIVSIDG